MRPRLRKVLSDLLENKGRTLLVVASIAVGVLAVGVIAGAYVIIDQDLGHSYTSANPANILLVTDPFDVDLPDAVARLPGVAAAEGRRRFDVRLRLPSGEWDTLTLSATPKDPQVKRLAYLEGARVPDERELLLERKTREALGVSVGDVLEIELSDGTRRKIRVAGVVRDATLGYGAILGDYYGYVSYESLEWLGQPTWLNRLYVTVAERPNDREHLRQVANQLTEWMERSGRRVYRTELARRDVSELSTIIKALVGVLGVLGVLIVFLSSALISNTMSALLAQHLRQIGIMKLIGARRWQVIGMYWLLIELFGVAALVVALPTGSWGAYALSAMVADIVNFDLGSFRLVPQALLLQVIIALLLPPLVGLLPVWSGARTSVRRAIANTGLSDTEQGPGWLDRQLARIRWLSRPLLISIRNAFRRKRRLLLTLLTLVLGGAIFIAVFNTRLALNLKVEETTRYFRADVNLDLARPYRISEIRNQVLSIPGVRQVEVWTITSAERLNSQGDVLDNLALLGPPSDTQLVDPIVLQGRWLLPDDQNAIVINEAFWADEPDLGPGDRLRLRIAGDDEDDWIVVGVFQFTGTTDRIAYVNGDYLAAKLHRTRHASAYRIITERHDLASQTEIAREVESKLRAEGYDLIKVEAGGEVVASATNILGILITVLLVMALLTALVGSIGLAGTMSMNVLERTREIGVLRAVGADNGKVARMVMIEGLVIGLLSYGLAAAFSFPITALLSNVVSQAIFNTPADFRYTPWGFVLWFGVVLALSTVASLLPTRHALRLTIREVLAYE